MDKLKSLFEKLSGYKTYAVGISAIIYGLYVGDNEIILVGLGLMGLRNGITSEIAKFATRKK